MAYSLQNEETDAFRHRKGVKTIQNRLAKWFGIQSIKFKEAVMHTIRSNSMAENNQKNSSDIVVYQAKSSISDLWKKEDYWAIWLGFLILIIGLVLYLTRPPAGLKETIDKSNAVLKAEAARAPFKTIAWHKANDAKKKPKALSSAMGKKIKTFTNKPTGGARTLSSP